MIIIVFYSIFWLFYFTYARFVLRKIKKATRIYRQRFELDALVFHKEKTRAWSIRQSYINLIMFFVVAITIRDIGGSLLVISIVLFFAFHVEEKLHQLRGIIS